MTRRAAIGAGLAAAAGGTAFLNEAVSVAAAERTAPDSRRESPKRYQMKKSINLWAFPYPDRMTLRECLQLAKDAGFEGIELNYDLENDLSPKAGATEYKTIRKNGRRHWHRNSGPHVSSAAVSLTSQRIPASAARALNWPAIYAGSPLSRCRENWSSSLERA